MKLRESIRLESNEFRRAVARAKKLYGDWLDKCMRVAAAGGHDDGMTGRREEGESGGVGEWGSGGVGEG